MSVSLVFTVFRCGMPSTFRSSTRKVRDSLQMIGLGKQIDEREAFQAIPPGDQASQITRKRGRIAGYDRQARRTQVHDALDHALADTGTRRIHQDEVRSRLQLLHPILY